MSEWSTERHEAAKARCAAATPGPWIVTEARHVGGEWNVDCVHMGGPLRPLKENAEFSAMARDDLPDALAEVERLKREVDTLRECQSTPPDAVEFALREELRKERAEEEALREELACWRKEAEFLKAENERWAPVRLKDAAERDGLRAEVASLQEAVRWLDQRIGYDFTPDHVARVRLAVYEEWLARPEVMRARGAES